VSGSAGQFGTATVGGTNVVFNKATERTDIVAGSILTVHAGGDMYDNAYVTIHSGSHGSGDVIGLQARTVANTATNLQTKITDLGTTGQLAHVTASVSVSGTLGLFTTITASYISASHLALAADSLTIGDYTLTASEMALLDGVVTGAAQAGKVLALDADKYISGIGQLDIDGPLMIDGEAVRLTKWSLGNVGSDVGSSNVLAWAGTQTTYDDDFESSSGKWECTGTLASAGQANTAVFAFRYLTNWNSSFGGVAGDRWFVIGRDAYKQSSMGWFGIGSSATFRLSVANMSKTGAQLSNRTYRLKYEIRNTYGSPVMKLKSGSGHIIDTGDVNLSTANGHHSYDVVLKDSLADDDRLTFSWTRSASTNAMAIRFDSFEEVLLDTTYVDGDVEINSDLTVTGSTNLWSLAIGGATAATAPDEITIAGGQITATKAFHEVDGQHGATADLIHTINWSPGADLKVGQILVLSPTDHQNIHFAAASQVVTLTSSGGAWYDTAGVGANDGNAYGNTDDISGRNIRLGTHFSLDGTYAQATFIYGGTDKGWMLVAKSNNSG